VRHEALANHQGLLYGVSTRISSYMQMCVATEMKIFPGPAGSLAGVLLQTIEAVSPPACTVLAADIMHTPILDILASRTADVHFREAIEGARKTLPW
jgi:hypothetical protein